MCSMWRASTPKRLGKRSPSLAIAVRSKQSSRVARNDRVARPLTKGILDGNLLCAFEELPVPRQIEMTRQIATDRMTVLKDWLNLGGAW